MWIYTEQPGRPQTTIWRMRVACCIPKATNTLPEYIMLLAFPLQQKLHERVTMSRCTYIVCLVIVVGIGETVNNKSVQCCHGNETMGSLCTVAELQNVSAVVNNNKY